MDHTKFLRDGVTYVCPDKDSVCGDRPAGWCDTCPLKPRTTIATYAPQRDEIWSDIERELRSCIDSGCSADLDEVDCQRLLDLMASRGLIQSPWARG